MHGLRADTRQRKPLIPRSPLTGSSAWISRRIPNTSLSIGEAKEKLAGDDNFKLVSIRSRDEFLGRTSGYGYIDRAGEPEGAVWGHDTDDGSYHNEDGTTAGLDVLKGYLEESGASLDNELSFYCGTGWRATIPFLICYEKRNDQYDRV